MHNLQKIRIFRALLYFTYPIALIFLYPFALLRKKSKAQLFFFFDRYAIGGAQRVHLDILESIREQPKQVFFTRLSPDDTLKEVFYSFPNTVCEDIHFFCDNLLLRLFSVHYYTFYINRHRGAHVISSNSTFFYDLLPFISQAVTCTELLHNFTYGNNGMEFFGLANYKYLHNRMVIDKATQQNIIEQYKECHIPDKYAERIMLIEPGVDIPAGLSKDYTLPLKVLYAGRGGAQKRIYLLNNIVEQCIAFKFPVVFHFAGTMMDELSDIVKQNTLIHGQLSDQKKMYALYDECHVIIMTSAFEGFPMLIKEGMARGCVPVVTALQGNKTHLVSGVNALLMNAVDEERVVSEGIGHISYLIKNTEVLKRLSEDSFSYASVNFNKTNFIAAYKKFLAAWVR